MKRTQTLSLKGKINRSSATEFQKKVWKALLEIPAGDVRTYSWLARKVGSPRAARAVGAALKRNPFAPGVPCHRIIRKDGSLGGYSGRGGLSGKKKLLAREGYRRGGP